MDYGRGDSYPEKTEAAGWAGWHYGAFFPTWLSLPFLPLSESALSDRRVKNVAISMASGGKRPGFWQRISQLSRQSIFAVDCRVRDSSSVVETEGSTADAWHE
jgi:hypothetical protein